MTIGIKAEFDRACIAGQCAELRKLGTVDLRRGAVERFEQRTIGREEVVVVERRWLIVHAR